MDALATTSAAGKGTRDYVPNTYWKSIERRVARLFGTERIGTREGGPAPDFENSWVVGEVVCHPVPKWILAELAQAEQRQADCPKLRLLVIHEKGDDLDKALVVARLGDFGDWFLEEGPTVAETSVKEPLTDSERQA